MRIKGIRGDDSETPNNLIRTCVSDAEKRRVLMRLRVCWNRYDRRLAIYGNDGTVLGIAFADEDGTIRDVASPRDLTMALPAMSDAIRKAVDAQQRSMVGSDDTVTRRLTHSGNIEDGVMTPTGNIRVQGQQTGDFPPYGDYGDMDDYDDDYSVSDGVSEPYSGIAQQPYPADVTHHAGNWKDGGGRHTRGGRNVAAIVIVLALIAAAIASCVMIAYHVGPFADVDVPFADEVRSVVDSLRGRYASDGGASGSSSGHSQIADDQEATVVISNGDTIKDVIATLRGAGLPDQADGVYKAMESNGTLSKIQPGTYHFKGGESASGIARRIADGQLYPDGYLGVDSGTTIRAMTQKVQSGRFGFSDADFAAAMGNPQAYKADYRMLGAIPDGLPSLEGFVPAGVYDLSDCKTADAAVRKLLDAGEKRFESSGMDAATWFRTLIEASMLDKEIMYDSERQTVASVMDNRLAQDMPLQIDATVLYALGRDTGIPSLTDVEVDSPYNTYKNKGLPIGPICSGITQTSIEAVMNHPQTQYLYYCLAPANDGHHVFAVTYEEHQKNQAAYEAATGSGGDAPETPQGQ